MSSSALPNENDVSTSCLSILYSVCVVSGFFCALGGAGALVFSVFLILKGDSDGWALAGIGLAVGVAGLMQIGLGQAANVLIALERRTRKP